MSFCVYTVYQFSLVYVGKEKADCGGYNPLASRTSSAHIGTQESSYCLLFFLFVILKGC